MADEVTILHVSDTQFGDNHLFGGLDHNPYDTLVSRLLDDLNDLRDRHGVVPDLMVVTGDLAERALPKEFAEVRRFLTEVSADLGLSRHRVVVVPGNHDVNRGLCQGHFLSRTGVGEEPVPPYWPKWEPYLAFFREFYADDPSVTFAVDQEWSLFPMPELKLVVAGLNSTMAETHDDHWGTVTEAQCRWFADALSRPEYDGWLKIGAVHHNAVRGADNDNENLRDAPLLDRYLGTQLHLLLHGHTHSAGLSHLDPSGLPVLSTGSAAVNAEFRYDETPNQYQLLVLRHDSIVRYGRSYDRSRRQWMADVRIDPERESGRVTVPWSPAGASTALPDPATADPGPTLAPNRNDAFERLRGFRRPQEPDLLDRVAEVCRLRHRGATVERVDPADGAAYLRVTHQEQGLVLQKPVGVVPVVAEDAIDSFADSVHRGYASVDPKLVSDLVHSGPAVPELRRYAYRRSIKLFSFVEYQGLLDLDAYVTRQTGRLASDGIYPPSLYVPQRFRLLEGTDREIKDDALDVVIGWLATDQPRLAVLLGDFGRGKTFLLHELARRLPTELPHVVPMLLELRTLEKARSVDQLVAQHLAASGEERFDLAAFRYMLHSGRIALLLDGFDELALRVSYDRAADHLATVLEAVQDQAKVVLTSRTQHFLTDQQVRTALGKRIELVPGRRLAHLEDFTDEQIRAFLVRLFDGDEAAADARLAFIENIQDLLGLSRNPRMLSFIAKLPEDRLRAAQQQNGAIGSADLYRELLRQWLGYEEQRAHPLGVAKGLDVEDRWTAVTTLALRLWETTDRYVGLAELDAVAARLVEELADRQLDTDVAAQMIGSGTLLSRTDDGRFTFVHQSVMEWLVAAEAARLLADDPTPQVLSIRKMSPLMADFFCGLAGDGAADWADTVLSRSPAPEAAKENALLVRRRLGIGSDSTAQLAGQDLRGADLGDQDLHGADLTRANLTRARLSGTNLSAASLRGASLVEAHVDRADLSQADLTSADLTGARLRGTDLTDSKLRGSTWSDAAILGGRVSDFTTPALSAAAVANRDSAEIVTPPVSDIHLSLGFSPQGRLLALGRKDGLVSITGADGAELRRNLLGHTGRVRALAWSPDGVQLATSGDEGVTLIWHVESGRTVGRLPHHSRSVQGLAWSPDGMRLAAVGDNGVTRIWDPMSELPLTEFTVPTDWLQAAAWSPDGSKLAITSTDGSIGIWDTVTGQQVLRLRGHTGWARAVAWNLDGGQVATAGDDGARIWQSDTGRLVSTLDGQSGPVRTISWCPDGSRLATGGDDRAVRVWSVAEDVTLDATLNTAGSVEVVTWSPDGVHIATVGIDAPVRIWDPKGGQITGTGSHRFPTLWAAAWSPSGDRLATASDDRVRIWDGVTGRPVIAAWGPVSAVSWSPDGQLLAVVGGGRIPRVWDAATGVLREAVAFGEPAHEASSVAWSPDGARLAVAADTLQIWDPATDETMTFPHSSADVASVGWASSGRQLMTLGADGLRLWDCETATVITLAQDFKPQRTAAWSPDGTRLAFNQLAGVVICAAATGDVQLRLRGHRDTVHDVAWSGDGGRLATASEDGTARIWDGATGESIAVLTGHTGPATAIAWAPDGRRLATAGADGCVRVWEPEPAALLATLVWLEDDGWAVLLPDGSYKVEGDVAGRFWWVIKLCRFEVGELDEFVPEIRRLPADAPIL